MHIRKILVLAFSILAPICAAAPRDSAWLKKNDQGNRFEGNYARQVANPSIELVSLTGNFEPYQAGARQQLQVLIYLPGGGDYLIKAEELRPIQYYWMQSKETKGRPGWNRFENWPVDGWLKRLNVPADNLGVVAYAGDPKRHRFAPVLLFHSSAPAEVKRYIAKLRLGHAIVKGKAKIYRGAYDRAIPPADKLINTLSIRSYSEGSNLPLLLPAEPMGREAGWITVALELEKTGGGQKIAYTFCLYHQPALP